MATKKSSSAKKENKAAKKETIKKDNTKKITTKTKLATFASKNILAINAIEEIPADIDCICMQKKPNGNFYNFTLQQGRWVQSSAIPFPTKEACEEACC
jgi:hypothetical protein